MFLSDWSLVQYELDPDAMRLYGSVVEFDKNFEKFPNNC